MPESGEMATVIVELGSYGYVLTKAHCPTGFFRFCSTGILLDVGKSFVGHASESCDNGKTWVGGHNKTV